MIGLKFIKDPNRRGYEATYDGANGNKINVIPDPNSIWECINVYSHTIDNGVKTYYTLCDMNTGVMLQINAFRIDEYFKLIIE